MVSNCLWVFGSSSVFWSCGKSVCMNFYGYFGPTFGRRGSISCISKVSFIVGSSIFWSILSSNKGSVDSLRPFMVPSKKFAVDIFDQRLRRAFLSFPMFPLVLGCSMFCSILLSNRGSVDSLGPFILARVFAIGIFDQRLRDEEAFLASPIFPSFLGFSMFWSTLPSNRWSVDSLRPFILAWEFEQDWMQPQNI